MDLEPPHPKTSPWNPIYWKLHLSKEDYGISRPHTSMSSLYVWCDAVRTVHPQKLEDYTTTEHAHGEVDGVPTYEAGITHTYIMQKRSMHYTYIHYAEADGCLYCFHTCKPLGSLTKIQLPLRQADCLHPIIRQTLVLNILHLYWFWFIVSHVRHLVPTTTVQKSHYPPANHASHL